MAALPQKWITARVAIVGTSSGPDVNGHGKVDLIVAHPFNEAVSVLINNGDGSFADKVKYATGGFSVAVTTADVNGDGTVDLLVANRFEGISVLTGQG